MPCPSCLAKKGLFFLSAAKKNTFLGGTAVLMAGVVLVKIIGALYKIPLVNVLGEEGYGHFSAAYVIFNLLLTISTAGLPVALSKSISEANALGRVHQVEKTFRIALFAFIIMGTLCFLVMFFGAGPLAAAQGDNGAAYAIRALAPCVLFVCSMSAFRGYAQGHGDMVPTSVSQIIESLVKLVLGLVLASYFMSRSFESDALRLEISAAGAILGVTVGSGIALVFLVFWFFRRRETPVGTDTPTSARRIISNLIQVAIPVTIGSSSVAIVSLIDTSITLNRLQEGLGMAERAAVSLYGTYQGCMTLYNLPAALMIPFTAAVIPAISAARARRDHLASGQVAESALRVSSLISLPMGIGITAVAGPIIALIFPSLDLAVAAPMLAVLGLASIFVCIMLICNSILQANGFVNLPILTTLIGGVVKLAVNYVLVGNPDINIAGAPIGTLCCFAVVAILDMIIIARVVPSPPNFIKAFTKPLIASLLMGGAAWAVSGLLGGVIGLRLACIVGIGVGGCLYLVLVVVLKVFSKDDLALMPKGDKIAKILRIR